MFSSAVMQILIKSKSDKDFYQCHYLSMGVWMGWWYRPINRLSAFFAPEYCYNIGRPLVCCMLYGLEAKPFDSKGSWDCVVTWFHIPFFNRFAHMQGLWKKRKEMSLADFGIEKRNISQKTSEKNKMRHLKLQRHTQLLLDNILTDYIE